MTSAADVSAGGAELRHRQVHEQSPDASDSTNPGPTVPIESSTAAQDAQDGGVDKPKKTFGRTPDGTGE